MVLSAHDSALARYVAHAAGRLVHVLALSAFLPVALHLPRRRSEEGLALRPVCWPAIALAPTARARVRVVPYRPRVVLPPVLSCYPGNNGTGLCH
jgi:hypothetical protein